MQNVAAEFPRMIPYSRFTYSVDFPKFLGVCLPKTLKIKFMVEEILNCNYRKIPQNHGHFPNVTRLLERSKNERNFVCLRQF